MIFFYASYTSKKKPLQKYEHWTTNNLNLSGFWRYLNQIKFGFITVTYLTLKFFGSIGEQAFQTFFACLAVRSDWLKILKAGAPVLPKVTWSKAWAFIYGLLLPKTRF